MGAVTAQKFHFGEYTLDQSSYRLWRGTRSLRLEKMPMELLLLLVERRGELVSREEIAERLWGKDVFLDVDHGINTAIRKVRSALRDDSEKPRFVETVVGKGYRFAAPISSTNGASHPAAPLPTPSPAAAAAPASAPAALPAQEPAAWARPRAWLGIAIALAVLALAWALQRGLRARRASPPAIRSVAVLPLKNLSGDPSQEYFADGMTEELIGRLANIRGLRVISRTSVMRFKDTRLSVPEIARTLHVDAVVEGSVLREANRVRINVQLIRAPSDEHIWAREYQREYGSILVLQEEIAQTIARQIKVAMSPQQRVGLAEARELDPEAYQDYLKGRYYLNQRTEETLKRSIACFQQAVSRDPSYAVAYSGLADAYALLGFRGGVASQDALSRAKAAALKAVALDDTLAEPHTALAFIAETYEWDWSTAEREYKRALDLNPGDARAHHWFAGYLMYVGRFDQGVAEEKRALDLDPVSLPVNNALAGRLLVAGRYQEAEQQVNRTLQLDPHFAPAHQTLGWVYLKQGKTRQAVAEFQTAVGLSGSDDTDLLLDLGFAQAEAGNRQEARRILAKIEALHARGLATSGAIAILYGALGELDQAFAWLNRAYQERDPELAYVEVPNRRFEPLRRDPRLQQLARRMGLPNLVRQ